MSRALGRGSKWQRGGSENALPPASGQVHALRAAATPSRFAEPTVCSLARLLVVWLSRCAPNADARRRSSTLPMASDAYAATCGDDDERYCDCISCAAADGVGTTLRQDTNSHRRRLPTLRPSTSRRSSSILGAPVSPALSAAMPPAKPLRRSLISELRSRPVPRNRRRLQSLINNNNNHDLPRRRVVRPKRSLKGATQRAGALACTHLLASVGRPFDATYQSEPFVGSGRSRS